MNKRMVLVALASPAIIIAGLSSGPAGARVPRGSDDSTTAMGTGPGPVRPVTEVVAVEVFPTGDGPADEEVCNGFENLLEANMENLQSALKASDLVAAEQSSEALDNVEDLAYDAGCAIIF